MEHTHLVTRLLDELSAARAAITVSYVRLWRSAERTLAEAGGSEGLPQVDRDADNGGRGERRPDRDAG